MLARHASDLPVMPPDDETDLFHDRTLYPIAMAARAADPGAGVRGSVLADACLRGIALALKASGWRLAGLVQHNEARPLRRRCDMHLEDLARGTLVRISEDRGAEARGCVLMVDELLKATEAVRASLAAGPDAVVLNKFGKTEAEGGGMRSLIGEVVELQIPLVVAVPARNIEAWRGFAADLSTELPVSEQERTVGEAVALITGETRPAHTRPGPIPLAECCGGHC